MGRALTSMAALLLCTCISCTSPFSQGQTISRESCFGVDSRFSGRITEKEKASVPESLRDAFYIESVEDVTPAALKEMSAQKEVVAEETRGGVRYMALRDYRCVEFEGGVSGMMIVIERYRVLE